MLWVYSFFGGGFVHACVRACARECVVVVSVCCILKHYKLVARTRIPPLTVIFKPVQRRVSNAGRGGE